MDECAQNHEVDENVHRINRTHLHVLGVASTALHHLLQNQLPLGDGAAALLDSPCPTSPSGGHAQFVVGKDHVLHRSNVQLLDPWSRRGQRAPAYLVELSPTLESSGTAAEA